MSAMTAMAMAETTSIKTDEALVEAARKGDPDAYGVLVQRYRSTSFAYVYARLRNREEAEDVCQDAFVRAYVALDRFRTAERWAAWMMRILRNLSTDALRRRRGRVTVELDPSWPSASPTPERVALANERRESLELAVQALPEKLKVPLAMHYFSGQTYREIALALDLPESTVVGRLAAALRRLRRRFPEEV